MKPSFELAWPVPARQHKILPQRNEPGSFWEHRGDRFHCGVDIYVPLGSDVLAVDDGVVVKTELFTSSLLVVYWNDTFAITIQHTCGLIARYAEMQDVLFRVGHNVRRGDTIGHVGQVLDPIRITHKAPPYIQKLKQNNNPAMLHLELYNRYPCDIPNYLGGNTFGDERPEHLLDPTAFHAHFC